MSIQVTEFLQDPGFEYAIRVLPNQENLAPALRVERSDEDQMLKDGWRREWAKSTKDTILVVYSKKK